MADSFHRQPFWVKRVGCRSIGRPWARRVGLGTTRRVGCLAEDQTDNFAARHEAYLDEYAQWDRLLAAISDQAEEPELSAVQRSAALEAIGFFRGRFGEQWLRQVFDQAHPFADLIWNRAPWTRIRIADVAQAIREVEALPGGARLSDRYARSDQQSGAIFELDIAASALRNALLVVLEPVTRIDRKCDMSVTERTPRSTNTLFIEVQSVQDFGQITRRAIDVAERLAPKLSWAMARCEVLGDIYRIPTDAELQSLIAISNEFWKKCESTTEPIHLQLEDVMDVWAVPYGHPMKQDLIDSGVPNGFRSPAPDDPLRRTFRAVRQKIGQLPTLAPGLIVLRPPRLLLPTIHYLPPVVATLRQAIADAPQISAIALIDWAYRSTATPSEARADLAGAVVIHHADRHIFVREIVLIKNPSRAYSAGDRLIERLF